MHSGINRFLRKKFSWNEIGEERIAPHLSRTLKKGHAITNETRNIHVKFERKGLLLHRQETIYKNTIIPKGLHKTFLCAPCYEQG